ncbi:hypothetical protein ACUXPM_005653, partial [Ralstonia sp. 151470066-2]
PNNPHKATPNSLWGGSVFDANPGSGFGANQQSGWQGGTWRSPVSRAWNTLGEMDLASFHFY